MAKFARVNGDLLPVLNFDAGSYENSGVDAVLSGATVQPQGPALAFFTVTGAGHLTGAQVTSAIRSVEQLATVHIYEYTEGETNDTLAVALYPVDAWDAAGLQTAIRDGLTALDAANNVTVAGGATFTESSYPA